MKIAFLYAGQGSQRVGMGKDFYDEYPAIRHIFDTAYTNFDLKEICFTDAENRLNETQYTQPCMVAFAAAVTDLLLSAGITPDVTAGLSLGEHSALYAAGVLDLETLIPFVAYRGRIMQETTQNLDCKMVAILGATTEIVEEAVLSASTHGIVDIANLNCTGQIVIGGESQAVDHAADLAKTLGAKRTIPLNVSGPFHTQLMAPASHLLADRLRTTEFHPPRLPVIFNVTGQQLPPDVSIKDALIRQIKSPVQFEQTIKTIESLGIDTVIEIGPGKVLSGFVRKTAPSINTMSIDTVADFQQCVNLITDQKEDHQ